jgi:hypothetical protein
MPRHRPPACGSPARLSALGLCGGPSRSNDHRDELPSRRVLPAGAAYRPGEIACPSACCGADAWSIR